MIAKDAGTGKSFVGLSNYLLEGKKGEKRDRVQWVRGVNLGTDDLMTGASIMRSAANENDRVEKPVYHFSVNWHPAESDRVDQALVMEITREALKDLGLENHQAMIVAHKDTDHFHVHAVVNRIDPETGRAWTGSFSKVTLEKAMARLSLEHDFEVVPGHHNSIDLGLEAPAPDHDMKTEAMRFEERTGIEAFVSQVREDLTAVFEEATSWRDLDERFAGQGYRLEARGRGLTITDGEGSFAKPSAIGREYSRRNLEQRFREPFGDRKDQPEKDASERVPDLERRGDVGTRPLTGENDLAPLAEDLKAATTWRDFFDALEANGLTPHRKGRGLVLSDGKAEVKASTVDRDLSLGALENRFGQRLADYQKKNSPEAQRERRGRAREIERAVTALENFERREGHFVGLAVDHQTVLQQTQHSFDMAMRNTKARERLEVLARKVYRDPDKMVDAFADLRKTIGTQAAVARLIEKPEQFGKLRGANFLGLKNEERADAVSTLKDIGRQARILGDAVKDQAENREMIDADLGVRFDERRTKSIEDAKKDALKDERSFGAVRRNLERQVLEAAKGLPVAEIEDLPFRSSLRQTVVKQQVERLRGERNARFEGRDPTKELPITATPSEEKAFKAVTRYAEAKAAVKNAALRSPTYPWEPEVLADLRQAARAVEAHGKKAETYFSRFGVDKRMLKVDAESNRPPAETEVKSRKPRRRRKNTRILGLPRLGLPKLGLPTLRLGRGRGLQLSLPRSKK